MDLPDKTDWMLLKITEDILQQIIKNISDIYMA